MLLTLKQFLLNTFIMLFVGPFTLILYSCVAENKEFYLSTVLATYSCPVLSHYFLVLMNNNIIIVLMNNNYSFILK